MKYFFFENIFFCGREGGRAEVRGGWGRVVTCFFLGWGIERNGFGPEGRDRCMCVLLATWEAQAFSRERGFSGVVTRRRVRERGWEKSNSRVFLFRVREGSW